MFIKKAWFDSVPTKRDVALMADTVDVRELARMGSKVCFKWKRNGRSPQYWIDRKWLV